MIENIYINNLVLNKNKDPYAQYYGHDKSSDNTVILQASKKLKMKTIISRL